MITCTCAQQSACCGAGKQPASGWHTPASCMAHGEPSQYCAWKASGIGQLLRTSRWFSSSAILPQASCSSPKRPLACPSWSARASDSWCLQQHRVAAVAEHESCMSLHEVMMPATLCSGCSCKRCLSASTSRRDRACCQLRALLRRQAGTEKVSVLDIHQLGRNIPKTPDSRVVLIHPPFEPLDLQMVAAARVIIYQAAKSG